MSENDQASCPIVNESGKISWLALQNDGINRGSNKTGFYFIFFYS